MTFFITGTSSDVGREARGQDEQDRQGRGGGCARYEEGHRLPQVKGRSLDDARSQFCGVVVVPVAAGTVADPLSIGTAGRTRGELADEAAAGSLSMAGRGRGSQPRTVVRLFSPPLAQTKTGRERCGSG